MNWDKEFYYVECHTSFTYSYGKITTDVNEFDPIFIKGLVYKMTIEHTKSPGIKDYLAGWVKYDTCNNYGPGGRFMVEGDSNGWLKNHYTDFFLTPTQTEREIKLKEILYER
jgi:hypothetical protein